MELGRLIYLRECSENVSISLDVVDKKCSLDADEEVKPRKYELKKIMRSGGKSKHVERVHQPEVEKEAVVVGRDAFSIEIKQRVS